MLLSIVIPTYNEQASIVAMLQSLQALRQHDCELIVIDGGSSDNTPQLAAPLVDHCLSSSPGRARQMNTGALKAAGQWLLFLHADTYLPKDIDTWLSLLSSTEAKWGFFPVQLSGRRRCFRLIERAITVRSTYTRVATGDQAIFVHQEVFRQVKGFQDIPLMEDVALSKTLRALHAPAIWCSAVKTSSRRWESRGILSTVFLMWRLRLAYFLGASPHWLARAYFQEGGPG